MINKILREVVTLEDIEDATSERMLIWALREEVQRALKVALGNIKEAKEFDAVRHSEAPIHKKVENCKYYETGNVPRQCPAYGKKSEECGKPTHFNAVSRPAHS